MNIDRFFFKPITKADIRQVFAWRYDPPYAVYNFEGPADAEVMAYFLDPQYYFHSISDETGALLAFCSFGPDGQVPGGDYSAEALDIGLGVRPDLTGRGHGSTFVAAILDFARQTFAPATFRVTIAEFNKRAVRVWQKGGFRRVSRFNSTYDGRPFVILTKRDRPDYSNKHVDSAQGI